MVRLGVPSAVVWPPSCSSSCTLGSAWALAHCGGARRARLDGGAGGVSPGGKSLEVRLGLLRPQRPIGVATALCARERERSFSTGLLRSFFERPLTHSACPPGRTPVVGGRRVVRTTLGFGSRGERQDEPRAARGAGTWETSDAPAVHVCLAAARAARPAPAGGSAPLL